MASCLRGRYCPVSLSVRLPRGTSCMIQAPHFTNTNSDFPLPSFNIVENEISASQSSFGLTWLCQPLLTLSPLFLMIKVMYQPACFKHVNNAILCTRDQPHCFMFIVFHHDPIININKGKSLTYLPPTLTNSCMIMAPHFSLIFCSIIFRFLSN